jgi:hypothetical protein
MADPVDDLEKTLAGAVPADVLPAVYRAIDAWRNHHGGCRAYIARHSIERRHQVILQLTQAGLRPDEVAAQVGITPRSEEHTSELQSLYRR